jgi:hypothetical protein
VLDGLRHLLGVDVGGELGQDEEAAGREGGHVAADEIVDAVVLLGDEVGEGDQRQGDGLGGDARADVEELADAVLGGGLHVGGDGQDALRRAAARAGRCP